MSSVNQTTILGIVIGSAVGSILIGSAINHIWSGYSEKRITSSAPSNNLYRNWQNDSPDPTIKLSNKMERNVQACSECMQNCTFFPITKNTCSCGHSINSHVYYSRNTIQQKPSSNHSIATASAGTRRLRKKKSLSNR